MIRTPGADVDRIHGCDSRRTVFDTPLQLARLIGVDSRA